MENNIGSETKVPKPKRGKGMRTPGVKKFVIQNRDLTDGRGLAEMVLSKWPNAFSSEESGASCIRRFLKQYQDEIEQKEPVSKELFNGTPGPGLQEMVFTHNGRTVSLTLGEEITIKIV